ncbi:hypothetical protein BGZ57DRAFT_859445 [Hyaloscypha finlandica]|nr:hypothetical protein BGZ57DRAFT_859445 [Hyaloscypha finlandica]
MSNLESGNRGSTRPNITLGEATAMRQHWLNIGNDYEAFHEHYNTRDPTINRVFIRARLLPHAEIQHWVDEANRLYHTVLAGTTAQRDQIQLHILYGQLQGNRDRFRGRFESLRVDLRALGLAEPGEGEIKPEPEPENWGLRVEAPREPPSSQMGGLSHETEYQPPPSRPLGPSEGPRLPANTVQQPYPSITQRLNPGYRSQSRSPPASRPNLRARSPHPSTQSSYPNAERDARRLRDENTQLRADNAILQTQRDEAELELDRVVHWYKMQEEEIEEKDEIIQRLKEELMMERDRKEKK